MKFSSALFALVAVATAVRAIPAPQAQDGGNGIPPSATITNSDAPPAQTLVPAPEHGGEHGGEHGDDKGEDKGEETPAETPLPDNGTTTPATTTGPNGRPDHKIPYATNNALFNLEPKEDTWREIGSPGALNGTVHFAVNNLDKAMATFTAPQTYAAIEVWAYQRSDGGVMAVIIDGQAAGRIDLWNRTATGEDVPVMLFQKDLERKEHVVEFRNMEDPRTNKFGQFNIALVYITTEEDAEPGPGAPEEPKPEEPKPTDAPTAPTAPVPNPKPEQPPLTAAPETSQQNTKPGNGVAALAAPKFGIAAAAALLGFAMF